MEHYCQGLHGWFNFQGVYRRMVELCPDGGLIVEVGSFAGASSAFLGVEVVNSGRGVRVLCVDSDPFDMRPAQGALLPGPSPERLAWWEGICSRAGIPTGLEPGGNPPCLYAAVEPLSSVIVMAAESSQAASRLPTGSVSSVYVDGDHSREGVLADLRAWWPRYDGKGIFAGHDYGHPTCPGVREAVDGFFGALGVQVTIIPACDPMCVPCEDPRTMRLAASWAVGWR